MLISAPQGRNETNASSGVVYGTTALPAPRASGFTMQVRKGDVWLARLTNESGLCSAKVHWLPIESTKTS